MEIEANLIELKNAVALVAPAAFKGAVYEASELMTTIRLATARNDGSTALTTGLRLAATSHEAACLTRVPAEVKAQSSVCLPLAFLDALKTVPSGATTVKLSVSEDNRATLTASGTRYRSQFKGEPVDEFPVINAYPDMAAIAALPAGQLRQLLATVLAPVPKDSHRPTLTGVYLHFGDAGREMAAAGSDGVRLSVARLPLAQPASNPATSFIVPGAAARLLIQTLKVSDEDEPVEIVALDRDGEVQQAVFRCGDATRVVVHPIAGQWPDYEHFIRTEHTTTAEAAVADLDRALRIAMLFTKPPIDGAPVTLTVKRTGLSIDAQAAETGRSEGQVDLGAFRGKGQHALVNVFFLRDALAAIPTANVTLGMQSNITPLVITPASNGQESYPTCTHVVMPMNVEAAR